MFFVEQKKEYERRRSSVGSEMCIREKKGERKGVRFGGRRDVDKRERMKKDKKEAPIERNIEIGGAGGVRLLWRWWA